MNLTRSQIIKFLPAGAFFAGLGWDSLTMTRIDRLFDNFFLLGYLIILGGMIILTNFIEKGLVQNEFILKWKKWYPYAIQFLFGGLFSGYTVYYFQSASLTKASAFFLIIAILLVYGLIKTISGLDSGCDLRRILCPGGHVGQILIGR